jgi:hypothetical protein
MENKKEIENNEAIKNLLVLLLLRQGVDPEDIGRALGVSGKTITNRYPGVAPRKGGDNGK